MIYVRAIDLMTNHTAADARSSIADLIGSEGVVNKDGNHLKITQSVVPGMSVLMAAGVAYVKNDDWVATSDSKQQYWDVLVTDPVEIAISSNPGTTRVDLVCLKVDKTITPDADASNIATMKIVQGTPGAGAPALPNDHLLLAVVTVPNGASSITNAMIADYRTQIKIQVQEIPSIADRAETLTNKIIDGDDNTLRDIPLAALKDADWIAYTPTTANLTVGNGVLAGGYQKINKTVNFRIQFILGTTSAVGTAPSFSLPVQASGSIAGNHSALSASLTDVGTAILPAFATFNNATTVQPYAENAGGAYIVYSQITATVPFTWTASDVIEITGTYQAA